MGLPPSTCPLWVGETAGSKRRQNLQGADQPLQLKSRSTLPGHTRVNGVKAVEVGGAIGPQQVGCHVTLQAEWQSCRMKGRGTEETRGPFQPWWAI